jgi:hypothetical protein
MSDFLLDPLTHDLAFTNGKLTVVRGPDARAQRIKVAFKHVQGEWFLDQNAGTDHFGKLLGKTTDLSRRAELRRRLLGIPGVREVQSMRLLIDPRTRALSGSIEVLDVTGEPIAVSLEGMV